MGTAIYSQRLFGCLVLGLLLIIASTVEAVETTFSDANGEWTINTSGNSITIEFKPDANNVNCPKISFVQTIKESYDGMVVNPPSSEFPPWAYRDDDTLADGTYVDHIFCEKDPSYNGDDTQDGGQQGSSAGDGSATTPSKMSDSPNIRDCDFPVGKTMGKYEFETCAVCQAGPNAGTVLGCIKWKYERTKGDGTNGSVTLVSSAVEAQSQTHKDALTLFETNHTDEFGDAFCPEEIPAGDCANRVYNKKGPLVFHLNDTYTVIGVDAGVKKGSSSSSFPTPVTEGSTLNACDFVLVPKDKRICLRRSSELEGPDPQIPFSATFLDLLQNSCETVETADCMAAEHCGVRAMTWLGETLAAAAPPDTNDPAALILYTAEVDPVNDVVIFHNDALSSHPIQTADILNDPNFVIMVNPGEEIVFEYPGLIENCIPPDQLHLTGPTPNDVPVGPTDPAAVVTASVQFEFGPVNGQEVIASNASGEFSFTSGEVSPDGLSTSIVTDDDGLAHITFVGDAVGPGIIGVAVTGTELAAFSFFEIVAAPAPCLTRPGDLNGSAIVDFEDVGLFVGALISPDPDLCADMNVDGRVDGGDIQLFVDQVIAQAGFDPADNDVCAGATLASFSLTCPINSGLNEAVTYDLVNYSSQGPLFEPDTLAGFFGGVVGMGHLDCELNVFFASTPDKDAVAWFSFTPSGVGAGTATFTLSTPTFAEILVFNPVAGATPVTCDNIAGAGEIANTQFRCGLAAPPIAAGTVVAGQTYLIMVSYYDGIEIGRPGIFSSLSQTLVVTCPTP